MGDVPSWSVLRGGGSGCGIVAPPRAHPARSGSGCHCPRSLPWAGSAPGAPGNVRPSSPCVGAEGVRVPPSRAPPATQRDTPAAQAMHCPRSPKTSGLHPNPDSLEAELSVLGGLSQPQRFHDSQPSLGTGTSLAAAASFQFLLEKKLDKHHSDPPEPRQPPAAAPARTRAAPRPGRSCTWAAGGAAAARTWRGWAVSAAPAAPPKPRNPAAPLTCASSSRTSPAGRGISGAGGSVSPPPVSPHSFIHSPRPGGRPGG